MPDRFAVKHISRNVHYVDMRGPGPWYAMFASDHHWDNPDSDHEMMFRHMDKAVEMDSPIIIVGDFFCAMQGKYDRRSDKSKVREEHQCGDYLDALVRTAADALEPYAHHIVMMGQGNHECVDPETEVLTSCGWKPAPHVTTSDLVACLHPVTKEAMFARPTRTHKYEYSGDMHHYKSRSVDMMVTPNHRIAYLSSSSGDLRYTRSEEVEEAGGQTLNVPTSGCIKGEASGLSMDEIELAAWLMTDGTIRPNGYEIWQSKPEMVSRIKALLDRLGLEYSHRVSESSVKEILGVPLKSKPLDQHAFRILKPSWGAVHRLGLVNKATIPSWVHRSTQDEFDHFLDCVILGDGSRHKSSKTSMMLYGTREFLEEMQAACVMHGYRAMLSMRARKDGPSYLCLNITPNAKIAVHGRYRESVPYSGSVYCLTMPSGNFFARRNGKVFVTGNSAIRNRHETDLLERLTQALRDRTGAPIAAGGYTSWVRFKFEENGGHRRSVDAMCYHGSGGGGPVTKGVIQTNRRQDAAIADIYVSGHVHESWVVKRGRARLNRVGRVVHTNGLHICTPGYKDEYKDGHGGWHIETGKPPKPKGCYLVEFERLKNDEIAFRAVEMDT